jgi:hypothetical protein
MGYRKFRNDDGPQFGPPFLGFLITLSITGIALLTMAEPQGLTGALRSSPAPLAQAADEAASPPAGPFRDVPGSDVDSVATSAMTHDDEANPGGAVGPGEAAVVAKCNIDRCAKAYKSFRASDCTYQPFEGERRLCAR